MESADKPDEKRRTINDWNKSLTPEQKEAHYEKIRQAHARGKAERQALQVKAQAEAERLLPQILAHQIIESLHGDNFSPSIETVGKLRALVESGLTLQEMRSKHFASVEQKVWEKITRFMFKDSVAHAEDLGIDILHSRRKYIGELESRIRSVNKEIKRLKKEGKPIPASLYTLKAQAQDRKFEISLEMSETLHKLGVVGDKAKAAQINIHMNTPRPKSDAAIDVTPKVSLADLVGGDS